MMNIPLSAMIDYSRVLAVIKEKSINHGIGLGPRYANAFGAASLPERSVAFSNARIVQHPFYDFITRQNC